MTRTLSLSGNYPRRERLVKATWDLDKGLIDAKKLDTERLDAVTELVRLQERLGFGAATDGNLTWQDAFRGIVESTDGLEAGGVTRLFETNRFYRQPLLVKDPRFDAKRFQTHLVLERVKTTLPKKAILPSPYWFARAAKNETGTAEGEAATRLAELVNEAAKHLAGKGYSQIQFQDALLFYEKDPDLKLAKTLIETATSGVRATTILNLANGDATPHLAWASKLPVDVLGIDFVETHVEGLRSAPKLGRLQAAVIDSQESLIESATDVAPLVAEIEKRFQTKDLTLTHTWDLQFVPTPVAEKKLEMLSRLVQRTVVA